MNRPDTENQQIARNAVLIAIGNIASRALGLLRDIVIADLFGAKGPVSAFRTAEFIPRQFYDLLVGGMISSALIPVFSEYAEKDKQTLWQVASLLLSLALLVLGVIVIITELGAEHIARLLGADGLDLTLTTRLLRLTLPAMLFLSLSGIITGLLQALNRFTFPAFTAASFNAAIVVVTLVGNLFFDVGIEIVAIGLLAGSIIQIIIQLPGLRDARLTFHLDLQHPVLRRIGRLYQPIILGLVVTFFQTSLDRRLANGTGESSLAWMQNATTLIQFPMGLIVVAISLATLPTLSRYAASTQATSMGASESPADNQAFITTLIDGIKIVLILIIPATVALFVLGQPIINLLFEHGAYEAFDTQQTNLALRFYLLGLIFAAVDQLLVFAFYARQNTLTPALVGVASVGVYLLAVWLPTLTRSLQMTDLVLADSLKHIGHLIMMMWLIRQFGVIGGYGLMTTLIKSALAALGMGGVLWIISAGVSAWLPPTNTLNEIIIVMSSVITGGGMYLVFLFVLQVPELQTLRRLVAQKLSL
ncbi:MAG: murein biosynthesis integral membrane protein MurJ [Chloroflexota bacterium]